MLFSGRKGASDRPLLRRLEEERVVKMQDLRLLDAVGENLSDAAVVAALQDNSVTACDGVAFRHYSGGTQKAWKNHGGSSFPPAGTTLVERDYYNLHVATGGTCPCWRIVKLDRSCSSIKDADCNLSMTTTASGCSPCYVNGISSEACLAYVLESCSCECPAPLGSVCMRCLPALSQVCRQCTAFAAGQGSTSGALGQGEGLQLGEAL